MASIPEPTGYGKGGEAGTQELSPESMMEITAVLEQVGDINSPAHKLFEESRAKWDEIVKPLVEAIAESERLSEDDFAIRINTRDYTLRG